MAGIYIQEVAEILELSKFKANKLANEGKIPYHQVGNSKRTFDKQTILDLADSLEFKALRKSKKLLAYVRCKTKKDERVALQKIRLYCRQNNWKPDFVSQLDRKDQNSNLAYNKAVKHFRTGSQGLITVGDTKDIEELTKMFEAVGLDVIDFERKVKATNAVETVLDSGITRTKSAFVYC